MDIHDGMLAGISGAIGGGIATVLDWLDRKRVDDKFGALGTEMGMIKNQLATQAAEIKAIEKTQDGTAERIEKIDSKIDLLLVKVGELSGVRR